MRKILRSSITMEPSTLYARLPVFLQNGLVSIQGLRLRTRRFGSGYAELEREVSERLRLEGDALRAYQEARAVELLRQASGSAYWAPRLEAVGAVPDSSDVLGALSRLHVINKVDAREHGPAIVPRQIGMAKTISYHTSGTTGSALQFRGTQRSEREQWAVWWRYRSVHGIRHDDLCGYFGGRLIVPIDQKLPPFWRVNHPGRQIMFSGYHLGPSTARYYADELYRRKPVWLHGYPSTLSLLARYIIEEGYRIPNSIRIITTGGESMLPSQRRLICEAFGVPVRQHYGQAEGVANISECRHGRLHVDEDYSWVEFLPVAGQSDHYMIVGTNWSNPAFPLFRYDTGDVAVLSSRKCDCGSKWRVVESIDGRIEDFVTLPNGCRVGRLDHVFKDLLHIREAQLYQPDANSLTIRVVKAPQYDSTGEEGHLLREMRMRIGSEIRLKIDYLDEIPRVRGSKFRFVISDVE